MCQVLFQACLQSLVMSFDSVSLVLFVFFFFLISTASSIVSYLSLGLLITGSLLSGFSVSTFFPSKVSPVSSLTPQIFRRSSSDHVACIGVFSSFCWEESKMQHPHVGLQRSLCSDSACLLSHLSAYSLHCFVPSKLEDLLVPESIPGFPLLCLCLRFSCQMESFCCPLNWMNSVSELPLSFILHVISILSFQFLGVSSPRSRCSVPSVPLSLQNRAV